jgi:hypothetical protein
MAESIDFIQLLIDQEKSIKPVAYAENEVRP